MIFALPVDKAARALLPSAAKRAASVALFTLLALVATCAKRAAFARPVRSVHTPAVSTKEASIISTSFPIFTFSSAQFRVPESPFMSSKALAASPSH